MRRWVRLQLDVLVEDDLMLWVDQRAIREGMHTAQIVELAIRSLRTQMEDQDIILEEELNLQRKGAEDPPLNPPDNRNPWDTDGIIGEFVAGKKDP